MEYVSRSASDIYVRSFYLKNEKRELVLHVSSSQWSIAESCYEGFKGRISETSDESEMELMLIFMDTVCDASSQSPTTQKFLSWLFSQFSQKFLNSQSPVVIFPKLIQRFFLPEALRMYYSIRVFLEKKDLKSTTLMKPSILLSGKENESKLVATFGGQGVTEDLIQEIFDIYDAYYPLIGNFFDRMAQVLLLASQDSCAREYVPQGLDIARWVSMIPEDRPPSSYVVTAPVSFPLIAFIQLLNYFVLAKVTEMSISGLQSCFSYTCGHSQGVAVAAVIAASNSEDTFFKNSENMLIFLFRLGIRAQQAFPITAWSPSLAEQSIENLEGIPSPMLAISGLSYDQLKAKIDKNNVHLPKGSKIEIALQNGPQKFVCAGSVAVLCGLCKSLRRIQLGPNEDQSKVPFSSRKLKFKKNFLPVSAPFHSTYLKPAVEWLMKDVSDMNIRFIVDDSHLPVVTDRENSGTLNFKGDVYSFLARSILQDSVDWPKHFSIMPHTHIVDFGPGGRGGVGSLTVYSIEGTGSSVYMANSLLTGTDKLYCIYRLLGNDQSMKPFVSWDDQYHPRLIRSKQDGKLRLDTKFSRLLGKPPIMVAGMTPSTVNAKFVAACLNAGYHVEIAGGGHHSEKSIRSTIDDILSSVPRGYGVSLNVLFINQKQWGFQFPLVQVMRKEGYPIEGFDIAAGVPSTEVATEILSSLQNAGIRHISFKPGSIESIRQVVNIAKSNPRSNIILQWTGGRAGGHHSYEDFHTPIIETYSYIRSQPNVFLVGGSGFGDAEGMVPYFTGEWSVEYGVPRMPFDGVLMGSRLMVAQECLTSESVKELIVQTPGVENEQDWVKSYKGPAGGIITCKSELGEPIHMIANRGVLLWKDLDEKIFSLPKNKRAEALLKRKDYWISRINSDFQKVWFGKNYHSGAPCDLQHMTYYQVALRLIELLFVEREDRWIHPSHMLMVFKYLERIEERFTTVSRPSILPPSSGLCKPHDFVELFFEHFPLAKEQPINPEDVIFFVQLCQAPGQKPVPFIPIMNDDFETWFKKDSLWQSEDIGSVYGMDPERVCILQGPIAVKYSNIANQPVKDILDTINNALVDFVLKKYYQNDDTLVPIAEYAELEPFVDLEDKLDFEEVVESNFIMRTVKNPSCSPSALADVLSFGKKNWARAFVDSDDIVFGYKLRKNPFKNIFGCRSGVAIRSYSDMSGKPLRLEALLDGNIAATASITSKNIINVSLSYNLKPSRPALNLKYSYNPLVPYHHIHEIRDDYNRTVKKFYWDLWVEDSNENFEKIYDSDPRLATYTCSESVNQLEASNFCKVIGNNSPAYVGSGAAVPMDFAIVVCWKALIQPLFSRRIDGDILRLVHLSNSIRPLNSEETIKHGDIVDTKAYVSSIVNETTGKTVEVKAIASRGGVDIFELTSRFFYRGSFSDYENCFVKKENPQVRVEMKSVVDVELLLSKSWASFTDAKDRLRVGSVVKFVTHYYGEPAPKPAAFKRLSVKGDIWLQVFPEEFELLGSVEFSSESILYADPVWTYLNKFGKTIYDRSFFSNGGYVLFPKSINPGEIILATNPSNILYSNTSGDHNPVHTIPFFADFAELPGNITHGMWTSAAVRALVETYVAENHPMRVVMYEAKFLDMVLPGQKLSIVMRHVGMAGGAMIVKIDAINSNDVRVLEAEAIVEGPKTAYVFTGQGSQEAGMGMDLYKTSAVAKAIWDEAEEHMLQQYGVSILDIVQKNPTTKTVYFRGPKGVQIRKNYMSLTYDSITEQGKIEILPLFPSINSDSDSYTFYHPDGLLNATQFSQPAITMMEKAAFEDLVENKLVNRNSSFAGHSLGEYAALASFARIFTVNNLVDIVFYRGMTMQNAVRRDSKGRSGYAMAAVSPNRIGGPFNDVMLKQIITIISKSSKRLLEIVNYNIENMQYVVAGHIIALDVLGKVLNTINLKRTEILGNFSSGSSGALDQIILAEIKMSEEIFSTSGHIVLSRGVATIPLPGVDVPFHSSFLLSGVMPFRSCLVKSLSVDLVDIQLLKKKYIPNLVARPFDTSKEFVELVYKSSSSPEMKSILENWSDSLYSSPARQQWLGHKILIELLAYQFASPVRWIETQDYLFGEAKTELVIEIGPSFTLGTIAERTIKSKYEAVDDALMSTRKVWGIIKNRGDIFFENVSQASFKEQKKEDSKVESNPVAVPPPASAPVSVPVAAQAQPARSSPSQKIDSLSLPTATLLQIIIAVKMKGTIDDISLSKSIKDFAGGKSTLQNELVADLQKEFGDSVPEKAEEAPLSELGPMLGTRSPGKLISQFVNKLFASKMPAGFSASSAKAFLERDFGISSSAADFVLAYCAGREPSARFSDETQATVWLADCAQRVLKLNNITLEVSSSGSSAGSGPVVSSAEIEKITARQNELAKLQIDLLSSYLGQNPEALLTKLKDKDDEIASLQNQLDYWVLEHGEAYAEGIRSIFSSLKVRTYDSWWNWGVQDVVEIFLSILRGKITSIDNAVQSRCLQVVNRGDINLVNMLNRLIDGISTPEKQAYFEYQLAKTFCTRLLDDVTAGLEVSPVFKNITPITAPNVVVSDDGNIIYSEIKRSGTNSYEDFVQEMKKGCGASQWPFIHIRRRSEIRPSEWEYSESSSNIYFSALQEMATQGVTFEGRCGLMTGCGKGSIGSEILKGLLAGGANVVVTTSSFNKGTTEYFRSIYEAYGAKGSSLVLVPFNQGSNEDVKKLVDYIYASKSSGKGLGWDLDFIVPFGAISENGRELTDIDSKSELAHRLMLTNLLRLVGNIVLKKKELGVQSRPAQVILPMSPNHGDFGGDGLYGESKVSLEALLNRWYSESWHDYLSVVGAVIGWTRGTGLMNDNNMVAAQIELRNMRTFSSSEMGYIILGLMHPKMFKYSQFEPVWADLAGGMNMVANLHEITSSIRQDLRATASLKRALFDEKKVEQETVLGSSPPVENVKRRANLSFGFNKAKNYGDILIDPAVRELISLDQTVVITGFGEVGPWGNSRRRWEIESTGEFSIEGCIDMAWMMGMISFHNGRLPNGKVYCGWVDTSTNEPVNDFDVKAKYEEKILKHTGIRLIEPELWKGYNPDKKVFYREVSIENDMSPIEVSKEEAEHFSRHHGDKVDSYLQGSVWMVKFKKGTTLYIPKALRFDRFVAGQIPTGWDATRYGVPKDMVTQVDPSTLYTLVATVEALVCAGITDPYEFYQYVHVTEVGNTSGGGAGGQDAQHGFHFDRYFEKPVQNDILQEFFINTMPAWVNLLLLSSSGPIKTPVGACATAVESVDIGIETILGGKARVVIVGGYDGISPESSCEFANMNATSNSQAEVDAGRDPKEMSRPTSSSRSGFMESEGAGIQVLMTASLAIQMGCPIYAIAAFSGTATDKEGRSIPAPGQGILTTARKVVDGNFKPRNLDANYRLKQFKFAKDNITRWMSNELEEIAADLTAGRISVQEASCLGSDIEMEAKKRLESERKLWGHSFYLQDPRISPLEGALSVFGLTVNDINVVSFHGTSTKANDYNESSVVDRQMRHLGRSAGRPLPCVFQKHLTGHPKGAAAAWMINGAIQSINSAIIPGNRNADNIDQSLRKFTHLHFPSRTFQIKAVRAALIKSFGFGQVGGEVLLLHPDLILGVLSKSEYEIYVEKRRRREINASRYYYESMMSVSGSPLIRPKNSPPYPDDLESSVYLNPLARAKFNSQVGSWVFDKPSVCASMEQASQLRSSLADIAGKLKQANSSNGVDVQLIADVPIDNIDFVRRNFTESEIVYCQSQPDPHASFSGRWSAKEAVVKALHQAASSGFAFAGKLPKGSALPLIDIEIVPSEKSGKKSSLPKALLRGQLASICGGVDIQVSISHSGDYSVAIAQIAAKN